eukprot:3038857-Rhodomonas_salina.1
MFGGGGVQERVRSRGYQTLFDRVMGMTIGKKLAQGHRHDHRQETRPVAYDRGVIERTNMPNHGPTIGT